MKSFDDSMFNTIVRFSERLGPIATLADRVLDRLIPKATAKASCKDNWVAVGCSDHCCGGCGTANPQMLTLFLYSDGTVCLTCSSLWC